MKRIVMLAVLLVVATAAIAWDTDDKEYTFSVGSGLITCTSDTVTATRGAWDTMYIRTPVVNFASAGEYEDMVLKITMDSLKTNTTAKSADSFDIIFILAGSSGKDTTFSTIIQDSMNTAGDSLKYYIDPQTLFNANYMSIRALRLDIYFVSRDSACDTASSVNYVDSAYYTAKLYCTNIPILRDKQPFYTYKNSPSPWDSTKLVITYNWATYFAWHTGTDSCSVPIVAVTDSIIDTTDTYVLGYSPLVEWFFGITGMNDSTKLRAHQQSSDSIWVRGVLQNSWDLNSWSTVYSVGKDTIANSDLFFIADSQRIATDTLAGPFYRSVLFYSYQIPHIDSIAAADSAIWHGGGHYHVNADTLYVRNWLKAWNRQW